MPASAWVSLQIAVMKRRIEYYFEQYLPVSCSHSNVLDISSISTCIICFWTRATRGCSFFTSAATFCRRAHHNQNTPSSFPKTCRIYFPCWCKQLAQKLKTGSSQVFFFPPTGQYLYINCTSVATFEWHPFTITSSPLEPTIQVHIRDLGMLCSVRSCFFIVVCLFVYFMIHVN